MTKVVAFFIGSDHRKTGMIIHSFKTSVGGCLVYKVARCNSFMVSSNLNIKDYEKADPHFFGGDNYRLFCQRTNGTIPYR